MFYTLNTYKSCWRHEYEMWQRMERKDWCHRMAVEGQPILYKFLWLSWPLRHNEWEQHQKMASWKQDCWSTDVADGKLLALTVSGLEPWGIYGRGHRWLEANNKYGLGGLKHLWLLYVLRNDCPSISCFQSIWSKIQMYPLHIQGSRK